MVVVALGKGQIGKYTSEQPSDRLHTNDGSGFRGGLQIQPCRLYSLLSPFDLYRSPWFHNLGFPPARRHDRRSISFLSSFRYEQKAFDDLPQPQISHDLSPLTTLPRNSNLRTHSLPRFRR